MDLAESEWFWVDGTPLSLQSSLWSCRYPSATTYDNVGYYSDVQETIDDSQEVHRFRLKNVSPSTVSYFICEGPLLPAALLAAAEKEKA